MLPFILLQHDLRQSYFCNPGVIKKDFRTFGFDMRNQTTDEQREVDEERRGADGEKTINLSEHVRIEARVRVGTNSFLVDVDRTRGIRETYTYLNAILLLLLPMC